MTKTGIWAIIVTTAFIAGTLLANPVAEAIPPWAQDIQQDIADIISGATPVGSVAWSKITGIPADIADGDQVGTGDITAVTAGFGLTGGGTTGSVTLSADQNVLQRRVTNSCPDGSSIRTILSNGGVICEPDNDTISITNTAFGPFTSGSDSNIQSQQCPPGQVVTGVRINPNPTVLGAVDDIAISIKCDTITNVP